ncbi:hypothetical protein AAGW05_01850 [Arthrobacter sp. LAPM80]|uniref:hypothetical protein n=1 Tax=Arthrobacter sp. LAPM80 TaxID=3141788 RepID=UPI00398AF064
MDQVINKWLILAFAIPMPVAHVLLGIANLHKETSPWPSLLAMVICLGLVVLVIWPTTEHTLPLASAWVVVAGVVSMDVLVTSVLPVGGHPGYAAWHHGAVQMLLVATAFRNRLGLAWLGMMIYAVLDFRASMHHGLSVVDGLAFVLTPIMWMAIASAVIIMLGRSRSNIAAYTAQSRESATRLAREHAQGLYRDKWILELEQATRPALEAIAAGNLTDMQRADLALLEAELRDQIRGRLLATPEVARAARAARRRGVKVDLLDDRKVPLAQHVLEDAVARLVQVLNQAVSGAVRARALPAGEDPMVTILAFDETEEQNEIFAQISDSHIEQAR